MHHFDLDLYSTEWVARHHKEVETRFLGALTRLPQFGPGIDAALQEYVDGSLAAAWPRGNNCWRFSSKSERYFGPTKGAEVQKAGKTPLLAKRVMDPEMRREKVQVQLIDKPELEQVADESRCHHRGGLTWVSQNVLCGHYSDETFEPSINK